MFSARDVEQLFAQAGRRLQRSQAMFDERYGSAQSATHTLSKCSTKSETSSNSSSASFAPTLRALHELAQLRDYLAGCVELVDRTAREVHTSDLHTTTNEANGTVRSGKKSKEPFALVRRLSFSLQPDFVPTARTTRSGIPSSGMTREAQLLWWPFQFSSDAEETHTDAQTTTITNVLQSGRESTLDSVAGVAAAVLRAGFYAEAHRLLLSYPNNISISVMSRQEMNGDALYRALYHAAQFLPRRVMDDTLSELVQQLLRCTKTNTHSMSEGMTQRETLCMSLLCFPNLMTFTLLHGPHELLETCIFQPLTHLTSQLLAQYRASVSDFTQSCTLAVAFVMSLTAALLQRLQARVPSLLSTDVAVLQNRGQRVLRTLHETLLHPLETQFVDGNARPGMAHTLQSAFVQPYREHLLRLLTSLNRNSSSSDNILQSWAKPLLCTALYRALLVIETVARAELRMQRSELHPNNTATTSNNISASAVQDEAWRQTRYQSLLKAAHGKMSTTLLRTIAEDRQMLLEAMPSLRSSSGHKLYKLHRLDADEETCEATRATTGKAKALYVYVDDGIIHYKQPRMRAFQAATSVEEVFAQLA